MKQEWWDIVIATIVAIFVVYMASHAVIHTVTDAEEQLILQESEVNYNGE